MKKRIFSIKRNIYQYFLASIAICGVFVGIFFLLRNTVFAVSVVEPREDYPGVIFDDELEAEKEHYVPESNVYAKSRTRGDSEQATEVRYDTRDYITTRVKNQGEEGTCWAYSITTAIEYILLKQYGLEYEFSPKIMDYRFVAAEEAYKESGVANAYYERIGNTRTLGGGNITDIDFFMFNDPLALVPEYSFLSVMKNNDNRLVALGLQNSYDELWSKDYDSVTVEPEAGGRVYNVKQSYAEVNNADDATFVVTGSKEIRYPYYELDEDPTDSSIKRANVIQDIKNMIKKYGAVRASFRTNTERVDGSSTIRKCSYVSRPTWVRIDKGEGCKGGGGHAVALVGWDDEITYQDGDKTKQGAFIFQNSYGDDGWNNYLSYDSELRVKAYYDIESYYDYKNHYSIVDYLPNNETPTSSEHIFSFHTNKEEILTEFTFIEGVSTKVYDVYIKSAGTNNEYLKVSNNPLSTHLGINKYEFENDVIVNGDFSIKLVRVSGSGINDANRKFNNLMLISNDIYRLSFDPNGGEGSIENVVCNTDDYDCAVTIPSTVPTRDNYTFLGWANSAGATTPDYESGKKVYITNSKTVYAVWRENTVPPDPDPEPDPKPDPDPEPDPEPDPKPAPEGTGGIIWIQDQTHTKDSKQNLVVKVDYNIESFVSLKIDSTLVPSEHYTVTAGSTVVSINHDFVDTLASGEHTIALNFTNDTVVNTTFTVEETSDDPTPAPTPDPAPSPTPIPTPESDDDILVPDTGTNTNDVDNLSSITVTIVTVLFGVFGVAAYVLKQKKGHYKYD